MNHPGIERPGIFPLAQFVSAKMQDEEAKSSHMHCSVLQAATLGDGAKQTRLLYKLVEQTFLIDQLGRAVEFGNLTVIEHYDAIRIEDGVDAMSDGDDGSVLEHVAAQSCL